MRLSESKTKQFSYTNSALAASLNVVQSTNKEFLSQAERDLIKCAAVRLSLLDDPSVAEINHYFENQENLLHELISSKNQAFEPPIDNEL